MTAPDAPSEKPVLPLTLKILAAAIIVVGLVGLFVPAWTIAVWIGRTDLEVQFLVTDASTGKPIRAATVHVVEEEELRPQRSFTLTTDQNGYARQILKNCKSTGRKGLFEDSFFVNLPFWSFHASAAGHVDSQEEKLHSPEFASAAERGPPFATLQVPIQLEKVN